MVLLHFNKKKKKKEMLDTLRPSAEIKPGKKERWQLYGDKLSHHV